MEKNDSAKIYQEYAERFSKMTDAELVDDFKRLFKDNGWIGRKITYLGALQAELGKRKLNPHPEMTREEFLKKYSGSVKTRPGVVTQIINCHHKPPASTPRMYFDIAEMKKAGWSKERILEKIKETFRQKGMLKD